MESINLVLKEYKLQVRIIENSDLTKIRNLKEGINLSGQTILDFRLIIRAGNGFSAQEDEIHFFKNIKPFILGRLQFFGELQKFELKWPKADVKTQKKYIRAALKKIDQHKNDNINFWRYVKNKQSQQDSLYFLRSTRQIGINCDMSHYIVDPEFSTSYDNLMAHFV
ncbi:RteC domain-containing protein, partial [Gelidibacter gilvus]